MELQRLTDRDVARLRAIRLRSLREAPDAFGSTYERAEQRTDDEWAQALRDLPTFVVRDAEADLGMVRCGADSKGRDAAWLISMWVAPEARGRGVGDRLIEAVVGWARENGYPRVLLDVADENAPAVALYARHGFEPTGEVGTLPAPREHVTEHRRERAVRPEETR